MVLFQSGARIRMPIQCCTTGNSVASQGGWVGSVGTMATLPRRHSLAKGERETAGGPHLPDHQLVKKSERARARDRRDVRDRLLDVKVVPFEGRETSTTTTAPKVHRSARRGECVSAPRTARCIKHKEKVVLACPDGREPGCNPSQKERGRRTPDPGLRT